MFHIEDGDGTVVPVYKVELCEVNGIPIVTWFLFKVQIKGAVL